MLPEFVMMRIVINMERKVDMIEEKVVVGDGNFSRFIWWDFLYNDLHCTVGDSQLKKVPDKLRSSENELKSSANELRSGSQVESFIFSSLTSESVNPWSIDFFIFISIRKECFIQGFLSLEMRKENVAFSLLLDLQTWKELRKAWEGYRLK